MAASPSTVISEGFGTFGSVNLLITDGYGIGTAVGTSFNVIARLSAEICRTVGGTVGTGRNVRGDAAIARTVGGDVRLV